MEKLSCCSFAVLPFFFLISYCLGLKPPLCHKEERSSLLQFKQHFSGNLSNSTCSGFLPKLASWKLGGPNGNCCSWDGVECDLDTGYVIGLDLSHACLFGSIDSNSSLFRLVHLQKLNLSHNDFHHSKIPQAIENLLELRYLNLSFSHFSGQISYAISKLHNLLILDLSWATQTSFDKPLLGLNEPPLKVRNPDLTALISNLTRLEKLNLNGIDISSVVSENVFANFTSLKFIQMEDCGFEGKFPEKLFQLQNLQFLSLMGNPDLYGRLPEFNTNNSLQMLMLSYTMFYGKLPYSIGNLSSLTFLHIENCKFSGSIPFSLGNLTKLKVLQLSGNNFSGPIPSSLQNLARLDYLGLKNYNSSLATNWPWLGKLNKLRFLGVSAMNLSGTIFSSISNMTSLVQLEMNDNQIIGMLPKSLGNFSSLEVLILANNMFSGSIPDSFGNQSSLRFIDLSNNQLEGQIPRSLSNCEMLQVINLEKNKLNDVFPSWLGTLPNLRVLLLASNQFQGAIGEPKINSDFSKLRVIDLSCNKFHGNLPFKYMSNWNGMKNISSVSTYIGRTSITLLGSGFFLVTYFSSITINHKSSQRDFKKVQEVFTFIDLSCNKFEGEIPYSIGNLKGLQSLNLSYNELTSQIPSSMGNLGQLEALDLSHNKLFGNIPQQLSQLTFLQVLDVSYNNLSGSIPQGTQLSNRENSSYEGNPNLCGMPLSNECQSFEVNEMQFSTPEEHDDQIPFWQILMIGYGCGIIFGLVLGNCVFKRNREWFMKPFRIAPNRRQRRRMRRTSRC